MSNTKKKENKVRAFLTKKNVTLSPKVYFVKAMSAMAMGLFASLLIGTIFSTLGKYITFGNSFLSEIGSWASKAAGCAIGVAIAHALEAPGLVLFSAAAVGMAGYELGGTFMVGEVEKTLTAGPAGAFIAVLIAVELGKIVSKQTKVDILVTPTVTIVSGVLIAKLVCPYIAWAMYYFGSFINYTTELHPIIMGMIVSALIGIVLTLPISSAAICAMISISGLAGGAAVAGCCAHMIGFAFLSYKENKAGGLVAQGIGTSMLQMGNLVKKPLLWIPPILISVITGPLATTVFKLRCTGVSAGMGTCGLVGPLGVLTAEGEKTTIYYIGIVLICFVIPALLGALFSALFRSIGMIKDGDLALDL